MSNPQTTLPALPENTWFRFDRETGKIICDIERKWLGYGDNLQQAESDARRKMANGN